MRAALKADRVEADFQARPRYQQGDYVLWITSARLPATREKRIRQMVSELKKGGVYMGMKHAPSARS